MTGGTFLGNGASYSPNVQDSKFFFVSSVSADNCESPRTLCQAVVNKIPVPDAKANPTTIRGGETTSLSASGGGTYLWSPAATLNNSTIASPTANPSATTTYLVKVTSAKGCEGFDSVEVNVEGALDIIPNVFTPGNKDGIGDFWVIPGAVSKPANKLIVFNRWGTVVKEENYYKNDWDGGTLPAGTYYFTFDDGSKVQTGTLTIVC